MIDELEPGHEVVKRIKRRVKERSCNRKLVATQQTYLHGRLVRRLTRRARMVLLAAPCVPEHPVPRQGGARRRLTLAPVGGRGRRRRRAGIRIAPTVRC